LRKPATTNTDEDMREKKPVYTVGRKVTSTTMQINMEVPQNTKKGLTL
jgi:hypothetical protein